MALHVSTPVQILVGFAKLGASRKSSASGFEIYCIMLCTSNSAGLNHHATLLIRFEDKETGYPNSKVLANFMMILTMCLSIKTCGLLGLVGHERDLG